MSSDEDSDLTHVDRMAAKHGSLREFHPGTDSIKSYLKRVSLYFTANDIQVGKRVALLLSVIGDQTYTLVCDLFAPDTPSSKSLEEITAALRNHYEPTQVVIAERFHFHKRDQAAGETIVEFDAALRKLAAHCEFGATLEDALRDRFVCGLRHENIQRRLLSEKDLTYAKALDVARVMEAAASNTKSFKTAIRKFSVVPARSKEAKNNCYLCGRSSHSHHDCKFKDATCHHCGKKGHIAPVCRSKEKSQQSISSHPPAKGRNNDKKKPRRTHRVQEAPDDRSSDNGESSGEEYRLHKLTDRSSSTPINVAVRINGKTLTMDLDTEAAVSIISDQTRKSLFPELKLQPSSLVLKTYTEEPMEVLGQLNVQVQYGGQEEKLVLIVVAGTGPSLFGRNWLKYIRLDWGKIASVRATQSSESVSTLVKRHQQLFTDELGTVTPYKAKLQVERLEEHGFRLKPEMCEFLIPSVEYLGHLIDQDSIRPLPSKVVAIDKAPAPTNVQELRSFLGLLN